MTTATDVQATKGRRTLLASLLMSSPGPILTGIAAASSTSATQIADFIRRSIELAALFIAWWVFRRRGNNTVDEAQRIRLERAADRAVTISMVCSAIALFIVGSYRMFTYEVGGNVTMGLIIACLGMIANMAFWWRYRSLSKKAHDPVLAGQQRLYWAKACIDLCVTIALATVAIIPTHPATRYVDAFGSIIVAAYLLYQAFDTVRQNKTTEAM